ALPIYRSRPAAMIYRNGIYYDKMIRNGVVYDRMVRNGAVYGDVQSGGFNWEIGINLSEQGRTDDVPGWNNIRKPTGPQSVGPTMEWTDLLDRNGVHTVRGLALTKAADATATHALA